MGGFDLVFCITCFAVGKFALGLDTGALRTLSVVTLVFSGQAVFYVSREREHLEFGSRQMAPGCHPLSTF